MANEPVERVTNMYTWSDVLLITSAVPISRMMPPRHANRSVRKFDQRAPALRREDEMQQDVAGSVGHASCAPPGLLKSFLALPTACAVGSGPSPPRGFVNGVRFRPSFRNWDRNAATDVASRQITRSSRDQISKLPHPPNSPLRSAAFLWYKQFTESSVWLAGRIVCNSRRASGI